MPSRGRRKWSKRIEESGVRVRLYERVGSDAIYREIRLPDGSKDRKSLKTSDRKEAEELARACAKSWRWHALPDPICGRSPWGSSSPRTFGIGCRR